MANLVVYLLVCLPNCSVEDAFACSNYQVPYYEIELCEITCWQASLSKGLEILSGLIMCMLSV